MAIQGLIGTGDFGGTIGSPNTIPAYERPTNWRQGILMRYPNGSAPLVGLTSAMKKKVTDDPQYQWWEREVSNVRLTLTVSLSTTGQTTITVNDGTFGGAFQVKAGDILWVEHTDELIRVLSITSATVFEATRGFAGSTAVTVTLGNDVNPNMVIVGSVYEEGASTPNSIRYRPTKFYNYTQIFRDSLKATRTAMHTRLRTVDEVRDAKQQTLLYHSIRMEYAFIHGRRFEGTGTGGEPERTTGGIIASIPSANIVDASTPDAPFSTANKIEMEEFEELTVEAFRFGSNEKMAFCGNRAMLAFQQMARRNSSLEITPAQKEFGMDVRRFFTPNGTLILKTHPLFNQITSKVDDIGTNEYYSMDSWCLVLDMGDVSYRPLRGGDTQYLPDRQDNGVDGLTSEYLTECGLEIHNGKHHSLWKGLRAGKADA